MGKIFISYRREDSDKTSEAIYKRLSARFGTANVFRDTYSIPLGTDFRQFIARELDQCAVQLVIIGHRWLTAGGKQPRLHDPDDLVRIEIETCLNRNIPVIPIVIEGAMMPSAADLPPSLYSLPNQNGVIVRADPAIDKEFGRLMTVIADKLKTIGQSPGADNVITNRMNTAGFLYRRFDSGDVVIPPVVQIPAGAFLMGSTVSEFESPVHEVVVPEFAIAVHPVTAAEYGCFVRDGHNSPPDRDIFWADQIGRRDHPIVNVSWRNAMAYAEWLSNITGQQWRLPTEAEWEKAARWNKDNGAVLEYPWGNNFDPGRCNTQESGNRSSTPISSFGPRGASACGVQDMGGNVWEWTSSLFKPYPYVATDGRERADSTGARVRRGGSWNSVAANARGAKRAWDERDKLDQTIGFRLTLGIAQA